MRDIAPVVVTGQVADDGGGGAGAWVAVGIGAAPSGAPPPGHYLLQPLNESTQGANGLEWQLRTTGGTVVAYWDQNDGYSLHGWYIHHADLRLFVRHPGGGATPRGYCATWAPHM